MPEQKQVEVYSRFLLVVDIKMRAQCLEEAEKWGLKVSAITIAAAFLQSTTTIPFCTDDIFRTPYTSDEDRIADSVVWLCFKKHQMFEALHLSNSIIKRFIGIFKSG